MDGEERKGKERKEKEWFGTEFVVMKLSKLSKIIIKTLYRLCKLIFVNFKSVWNARVRL